jgi:hypothetical protein
MCDFPRSFPATKPWVEGSAVANRCGAQAYDSHCNLVLGDVTETIFTVDEDDEEEVKVS